MSLIPSKMINMDIGSRKDVTLSDIVLDGRVPISLFGDTISRDIIENSITYMISSGGGEVSVPIPDNYFAKSHKNFTVCVHIDRNGNFITNYYVHSYRYPINNEERPYGGEWSIGDIVYNSDFKEFKSRYIGWVCVSSGIPGSWEPLSGSGGTRAVVEDGVLKLG